MFSICVFNMSFQHTSAISRRQFVNTILNVSSPLGASSYAWIIHQHTIPFFCDFFISKYKKAATQNSKMLTIWFGKIKFHNKKPPRVRSYSLSNIMKVIFINLFNLPFYSEPHPGYASQAPHILPLQACGIYP